jgi:hypothetical protein
VHLLLPMDQWGRVVEQFSAAHRCLSLSGGRTRHTRPAVDRLLLLSTSNQTLQPTGSDGVVLLYVQLR